MQVVSVNTGLPREVEWRGRVVATGIFKQPVSGKVPVRTLNLDGDAQADLSVHGGPDKAVYAYPAEHYGYWREQRPTTQLDWGMFGENLTVQGLSEETVHVGDRFRIGTAELVVTQPRLPCYKLGIRFADPQIVGQFQASGRTGFYFSVAREGEVGTGDALECLHRDEQQVSITEFVRLYTGERRDAALLERLLRTSVLPASWREWFERRR